MSRAYRTNQPYDPYNQPTRPSNPRYPHVSIRKIYAPGVIGRCPIYTMDSQCTVHDENTTELFAIVMKNIYVCVPYKQLEKFKKFMESTRCNIRWIQSLKMWAIDAIDRYTLRRLNMAGYNDLYDQNEKPIPMRTIELYARPVLWNEPTDDELIGLDIESIDYL